MSEKLGSLVNSRAVAGLAAAGLAISCLSGCSGSEVEPYDVSLSTLKQLANGDESSDIRATNDSVQALAEADKSPQDKIDKTRLFNALAEISSRTAHIANGGSPAIVEEVNSQKDQAIAKGTAPMDPLHTTLAGYVFGKDGKLRTTFVDHSDPPASDTAYGTQTKTTDTTIFSHKPLAQAGIQQTQQTKITQQIIVNPLGASTLETTIAASDTTGNHTVITYELKRDDSILSSDSDKITVNGAGIDGLTPDQIRSVTQAITAASSDIAALSNGILIPEDDKNRQTETGVAGSLGLPQDMQISTDGICNPASPARTNGHISEFDCVLLPPVTQDSLVVPPQMDYETGVAYGQSIGSETTFENLSSLYRLALKKATRTGDDTRLADARNWVSFYSADKYGDTPAEENARYDSIDSLLPSTIATENDWKLRGESGFITFMMDASSGTRSAYFTTAGSLTSVIRHEGTHSMYQQWLNHLGDPETKDAMDTLNHLWKAQVTDFLGRYYDNYAKDDKADIAKLIDSLTKRSPQDKLAAKTATCLLSYQSSLAQRDQYISNQFNTSGGYGADDLFIRRPDDYIRPVKDARSLNEIFDEYEREIFDSITKRFQTALLSDFDYTQESHLLRGIQSEGGHAGDATTEWVASTYASILTNPDGYVQSINAQSHERRLQTLHMLQAMLQLMNRWQPDMDEKSAVARVASQINAA